MSNCNLSLFTGIAVSLSMMPAVIMAQESHSADVLEEIIVTAERREQNLQVVPISITAFTSEQLNSSGVESTIDLQYRTPGFVFKTNSVLGQPYIRGVGSDLITAGADPAVATFVDGVYLTRAYAALQDFYDVERIEVVKGPQGTLYGRNATAGAINIISKAPEPEFHTEADLTYGNYDKVRVRALVNVPLVEDRAMLRVSGLFNNRDGFSKNTFLGKRVDDEDFWAIRSQLRLVVNSDVEILLSGDYTKEDSSRSAAQHPDPDSGINLALLPPFFGTSPEDPREVTHDFANFEKVESWGFSGKIVWEFEPMTLTSITAYREYELELGLDLDSTEIPLVVNQPVGNSDTITQELQLSSNSGGPLEWVVGFYFLDENAFQQLNVGFPLFLALNQPSGDLDTTAWALFGQGSYRIHDKIRLTAGLRYSDEERSEEFVQIFTDPFGVLTGVPGVITLTDSEKKSWDALTPKFGIDYFVNDDVMLYFSATRGFKAGGYNTDQLQGSFDPEYIWAYELGAKSTLLDGRARLNMAGFYYDYKDIQLLTIPAGAAPGTFPVVMNVPKARVVGFEADLKTRVFEGFDVDVGLVVLDAEFRDFNAVDPNNPQLGEVDRKGAQMPQAADFTINVSAQYSWPFLNMGELSLRGEYRYQSKIYFNTFQDPVVSQDGYSLANARLTFESTDGRWYGSLFAKNLFDELYAQTKIRQDPIVGNLRFWGAPRTYGLQLGYRY